MGIKMVRGEGMPTHKDHFNKGKLIVLFNITFPEKLDPSVAAKLAALLPKPKKQEIPGAPRTAPWRCSTARPRGEERKHSGKMIMKRLDLRAAPGCRPDLSANRCDTVIVRIYT